MQNEKVKLPTAKVILWTDSANKEGLHPVKLRLTFDRIRRYYPVSHKGQKLFLSPSDFAKLMDLGESVRKDNVSIRKSLTDAFSNADGIIDQITAKDKAGERHKPFTWDRFEAEYLGSVKGFLSLFQSHLKDLHSQGRFGTYRAYNNAFQAFNEFRGGTPKKTRAAGDVMTLGKELNAIDITPKMLKEFELFLKNEREAGTNTIAMYMRSLKVIFNLAGVPKEFYPFAVKQNDKGKYIIRTGAGKKGEALDIEDLQKFMDIETEEGLLEHDAKLYWLFSFYCQGMNMRDIASLRYNDIDLKNGIISYIRRKTKDTEREETPIEVPINDQIKSILIELGNPDKKPGSFVFNILTARMTPEEQYLAVSQKIKMIDKALAALCEANDLPRITTYWARHTYASLLKEAGESVELIRELLGHSDIRTTEAYLKRFDRDRKRAANDKVTSLFKLKSA